MKKRNGTRHLPILIAVALLAAVGAGAGAQDVSAATPLSIETAASLAVASSSTVRSLEISLANQLEDLGIMGYLDGIRLSLSGSLGGSPLDGNPDTDLSYGSSGQLSANVEIIPQLILNGNVTANILDDGVGPTPDPLTASLGLTLRPLADPTGRSRDLIAVERTTIDLKSAIDAASYSAIVRLLDAIVASASVGINREKVEVAEMDLANSEALFERDRISDEQLVASERSLRSARQNLLRSQLSAERASASLAQAVGLPADGFAVPVAESLELAEIVAMAVSLVQGADISGMAEVASGPQLSLLDVETAALDVRSSSVFSPELSVSASAALPDFSYSVSAEISVSPSDFDFEARSDAQAQLAQAERGYEYAVLDAAFDVQAALMDLEFAIEDLDDANYELGLAQSEYDEAGFLLERGEITDLEFLRAELDLSIAANGLLAAQIEVAKHYYSIELGQQ